MYHPHILLLFLLAASAIVLMMVAGLSKQALERKPRTGICPSCGRQAGRDCRCRSS